MSRPEDQCEECTRIGNRWAGGSDSERWLCDECVCDVEYNPEEQAADDYCTDGGEW